MPKGFELVTSKLPKRRLITRIGALEKDGKTDWALTAPDPIGVIDCDRGLEGVVEKFVDGRRATKEIYVKSYRKMPVRTQDDHEARWDAVERDYRILLADSTIRSILWDTDTEMWEMARMAFFGKLTQIKSHHYGEVNAAFRKLIDEAFDNDKKETVREEESYIRRLGVEWEVRCRRV